MRKVPPVLVFSVLLGASLSAAPTITPSSVSATDDARRIVMENGLIRREWVTGPDLACVSLRNLVTGEEIIRAVEPEASVALDGDKASPVGGLTGQKNRAFLDERWIASLGVDPRAFRFTGWEKEPVRTRLDWKQVRHHAPDAVWPPKGAGVRFDFAAPGPGPESAVRVSVHYEIYDGLPLMAKWIEVKNTGAAPVTVDRATTEILSAVEQGAAVDNREGDVATPPQSLYLETDYAFGGMTGTQANNSVVRWRADPAYGTQVNYDLATLCRLEVTPKRGPAIVLEPGKNWTSWNTFELARDNDGREREGLAKRRMYRTLAPWVTENPLMMHVVSTNPEVVKRAVDQASECGFEMVILSFGSGLNMEDASPANIAKFKALVEYAKSKHIELGGYSLLASRSVGGGNDVVSPKGTHPTFGNSPALASPWGQKYFASLRAFIDGTGLSLLENDGSYPGDWDDSPRPPFQRGLDDSQRVQWEMITGLYKELRAKGVFLNVPDWYFLSGSNKTGMGYRETNWSLPRDQQLIHTRQNIFDGTWEKTPSMGWMFVPLTQYHGGGAAATIEPLDTHIDHYERMLFSNLALGVQACYRGTRLYDTPRVRDMVSGWTAWYKSHREILESDLIHGRRADGRDVDWMVHVNPVAEERAMLCAFNPLDEPVVRRIRVPLREAGLRNTTALAASGEMKGAPGPAQKVAVDLDGFAEIELRIPANGLAWTIFRQAGE